MENVHRASQRLYSGGVPQSDAGFAELAAMGVKTVVSVDGLKPDVEGAQRHGLQYVHIPIGYDGVDEHAQLSLTRLMRDVEGPIYMHCHHGKHRGPAAAAVACLAAGEMTREQATAFLHVAGTGEQYRGLWRDVAQFTPAPGEAKLPELVAVAQVDSLAANMAAVDRAWGSLADVKAAGWTATPEHPDATPELLLLHIVEGLTESRRVLQDEQSPWVEDMAAALQLAEQLRNAVVQDQHAKAADAYSQLEAACKACHGAHRD